MRILIDPGHGGNDPGCQAHGLREKNINRAVADRIALKAEEAGLDVTFAREGDDHRTLTQRALPGPWDLVLSLHCDVSPDPTVGALSTYVCGLDTQARSLGFLIECAAPPPVQVTHPRVTIANELDWTSRAYNVLRRHPFPALLVEMGFLSNLPQALFLGSMAGQQKLANVIFECILTWKDSSNGAKSRYLASGDAHAGQRGPGAGGSGNNPVGPILGRAAQEPKGGRGPAQS